MQYFAVAAQHRQAFAAQGRLCVLTTLKKSGSSLRALRHSLSMFEVAPPPASHNSR